MVPAPRIPRPSTSRWPFHRILLAPFHVLAYFVPATFVVAYFVPAYFLLASFFCVLPPCIAADDLASIPADLIPPPATDGAPSPGKRVRQFQREHGPSSSRVHHLLYLPTDWVRGKTFPVIVEYAGNKWQTSPGTVEGSNLGYGISGGQGVIWICMPFVNEQHQTNAETWWGDTAATVAYCKQTVRDVCEQYGGDRANVFLAGFSRGAIACNYIGLHDDEIASLWRGFICHSHYEGVRPWPGSTPASAAERLKRLGQRPQFISHETIAPHESVERTREYLAKALPDGHFTFLALPFETHTDTWVLRDIPARKTLRDWFRATMVAADEAPIVFRHELHAEGVATEPRRAYSPSRKVVARSIGEPFKARVRLYDADTDMPIGPEIDLRAHRVTALAVSPDDGSFATAIGNLSNDWGEVRVWNGRTGKPIAQYKLAPEKKLPPLGEVFQLKFSEDGRTLTITSGPAGGK